MKKIYLLLIVLLFFNIAYAQDDWFYNSQSLVININVDSGAEINPKSADYNVDYIRVNLSHYPYESFNQKVISFDYSPSAEIKGNTLLFEWQNPKEDISFGYDAKIRTNNEIVKVREKIGFPLLDLPEELEKYTRPAEIIDSNDEDIIKLASALASGEDDLYVVVHNLAEWTKNNINYNLSTLTASASLKASWVLEQRQGVCDELTSLFIAMLRSLGIPAKFVAGVAYTNSPLFEENWGSHGWAEVYFPGYGWIPYDVTYGQFAYLDPTHVKLKESIDSSEPSVRYKWLGNVDLDSKELDIDADVDEITGRASKPISLTAKTLKENVGFGSYNLVEVVLENLEDYYVSSEVYISKPKEVLMEGNFIKNVMLKPREKKSVFWTVKVSENLERNFIYTLPITVSTLRNFTQSLSFKSSKNEIVLSNDEIEYVLGQRVEEEEKVYSKDVDINCSIAKREFYSYENNLIECKIKNLGNTFLNSLYFCLKEQCENFDLGIAREKNLNFTFTGEEGKQQLALSLSSNDVSKASYLDINVLDEPKIIIEEIEAPDAVEYGDLYKVGFLLKKESSSNPKDVEITLKNRNVERIWIIEELFEDRKFIINLDGRDLRKGINEFSINIDYKDGNLMDYNSNESFNVELANVTPVQNIFLIFNSLFLSLQDPKILLLVIIASILIFLLVSWLVFRRK